MMVIWASFFLNLVLFGIKIWAGYKTNSLALLADGWHTLSDCVSTIVVFIGLRWSMKPADKEHPFGHGRAETVAAVFVGFFLIMVSFEFSKEAVTRLSEHVEAHYGWTGIIVMVISVVVKEVMSQLSIRTGKKIRSDALVADGWHHRSDAVSSLIILVGIVAGNNIWWIDGVLTALLSLYLLYVAYGIITDAVNPLLGEAVDDELKEQIQEIGRKVYGQELHMHHFHIHEYGRHTEMTFHIVLPENMSLKESAEITRKLFRAVREETGIISTIHVDTESKYKNENDGTGKE
jgi:cation diffusion facilitator family transporter